MLRAPRKLLRRYVLASSAAHPLATQPRPAPDPGRGHRTRSAAVGRSAAARPVGRRRSLAAAARLRHLDGRRRPAPAPLHDPLRGGTPMTPTELAPVLHSRGRHPGLLQGGRVAARQSRPARGGERDAGRCAAGPVAAGPTPPRPAGCDLPGPTAAHPVRGRPGRAGSVHVPGRLRTLPATGSPGSPEPPARCHWPG